MRHFFYLIYKWSNFCFGLGAILGHAQAFIIPGTFRRPYSMPEVKHRPEHARQAPYLLDHLSGPLNLTTLA